MENKNLTAVEWLIKQVNHQSWGNVMIDIPKEVIEQAKAMEREQNDTTKITRFEVIDCGQEKRGRIIVEYDKKVEISIQDDGRTMKVFLSDF